MSLSARAFLFDFDGTLVNSTPLHDWAFRVVLATAARDQLERFDYESIKGLTTRHSFLQLGIADQSTLDWCVAAKQRLYREAVTAGHLRSFPGARRVLELIDALGAASFVVSSGSAEAVHRGLDACGLQGYFEGIITAEDAPAGKPAPAPYQACLARFNLDRTSAIAVEDAPAGVQSAHAAGLQVAGVHDPAIAAITEFYFRDFDAMLRALGPAEPTTLTASV
jgi:HAD superfamily hydrolase (TIGR01509 family)